ncbi:MAG: diguanylate cyclase [Chloroflexi bacterium]|nr:diguanylate cyclase [Chloroflexota bacterium]
MLLALVVGVVLVLVGLTASALVTVTSVNLSTSTLNTIASRDASLVALFVNDNLRPGDLGGGQLGVARRAELTDLLAQLGSTDSIVRLEIRDLDGRVIVSDESQVAGEVGPASTAMASAATGSPPPPALLQPGVGLAATGGLANPNGMIEQFLPILDGDGRPLGVVGLWRDAGPLLASLAASAGDIMLVTLAAGAFLAALLVLVFRASQARLSRQHRQLLDASRTDALTGLLNHGEVVMRLATEVESMRGNDGRIGIALIDLDNFRGFNATHGHDAADQVLLRVAALIAREQPRSIVARYGPDEFLLVRPGAGVSELEAVAEQLRADLQHEHVQFGDSEQLPITVSAGVCAYPEHATSVTELLSAAAVAVGEAKASGGDGVRVARIGEEDRVVSGSFDVLQGLVIAVDTKDRYTKRHSEDVARYAVFLARRIGLDQEMLETIRLAGLLHDIGKIGIPDVVLRKPSSLTDDEYNMFKQHVALGDAIVRDVPNVEIVRAGIRHHHERWDGHGYLTGLAGEEIPVIGRILAVADAFSAMTTTRPYRKALSVAEALKRLEDAAGTQLQEELVAEFVTGIETAPDAPLPGEEPTELWRPQLWVA